MSGMNRLRNRDRLISLKYSTIEACFSVPMLNLTMPNFPFVLVFAVKVLGWNTGAVGVMAALPHICNCLQPFMVTLISRRLSNYHLLMLTFAMGALPWSLAGFLPIVGPTRSAFFAGMLVVATLASSVASVAWSAAISEVVPERLGGRYFARRNLIFGAWTLAAVILAGHIVEWSGNSLSAFIWIFSLAGLSRLLGLFFLTRMKFPLSVKQRQTKAISLADLWAVFRDPNYVSLCLFIGCWGFFLNASMPFYTVYLVGELNLGIGTVVKLTTLASLGGLLTLKGWGKLCDRFGNRAVLQVCALIWALTALIVWSLARPGWTWHLYLGYFIVGATTAGFQLTQFNLMIRLAHPELRPAFVAVFLGATSLLTAVGPVIGGAFLKWIPLRIGQLFGYSIFSYHLLFALSGIGCVLASQILQRVHEPIEQPLENVWREMGRMRTFNPMLSVLSVGELLLTPRGLVALARRSLRTVRQQARALEDVGEEILAGGREVLGTQGDAERSPDNE
jgi:MFS family permease